MLAQEMTDVAAASEALGLEVEKQVIPLSPPLFLPLDSVSISFSAT